MSTTRRSSRLPNSRKVYVDGSRPDIRVPMREITQSDTPSMFGGEPNPPVFVYDCSGPYSDPAAKIDIRSGLAPLRQKWIEERNDTELLNGPSSAFGKERLADPKLAELRFNLKRAPEKREKPTSRRCTTRARASSRPRWSSSPSARTCSASSTSRASRPPARPARRCWSC